MPSAPAILWRWRPRIFFWIFCLVWRGAFCSDKKKKDDAPSVTRFGGCSNPIRASARVSLFSSPKGDCVVVGIGTRAKEERERVLLWLESVRIRRMILGGRGKRETSHAQQVMGPSCAQKSTSFCFSLVLDFSFFGFFNGMDLGFSQGPSYKTLINNLDPY